VHLPALIYGRTCSRETLWVRTIYYNLYRDRDIIEWTAEPEHKSCAYLNIVIIAVSVLSTGRSPSPGELLCIRCAGTLFGVIIIVLHLAQRVVGALQLHWPTFVRTIILIVHDEVFFRVCGRELLDFVRFPSGSCCRSGQRPCRNVFSRSRRSRPRSRRRHEIAQYILLSSALQVSEQSSLLLLLNYNRTLLLLLLLFRRASIGRVSWFKSA